MTVTMTEKVIVSKSQHQEQQQIKKNAEITTIRKGLLRAMVHAILITMRTCPLHGVVAQKLVNLQSPRCDNENSPT